MHSHHSTRGWKQQAQSAGHNRATLDARRSLGLLGIAHLESGHQIDEAHGLNPLRADLIEITDTVRLGLHLTIELRQSLCPIALIRIQLPVFLFIKQMKLIDLLALSSSLDEVLFSGTQESRASPSIDLGALL